MIELNHDLLNSLTCPTCQKTEPLLASLGRVTETQGRCPKCGEPRTPNVYHTIDSDSPLLDRTLGELGVPAWDILGGRTGMQQRFYEFVGDRAALLGALSGETPAATIIEDAP